MTTWNVPVGQAADRRRLPAAGGVANRAEDARRCEAAHLVVGREADADLLHVAPVAARLLLRLELVEAEVLEELVERGVVVAVVDRQPRGERGRELRDEVLAPQLEPVDPELEREQVHRALEHVGRLGPAGAAVGVGRRRVREHARERDAVVRDRVRACVDPGAEQRDAGRDELEIRPHRGDHVRPDRGDLAVLRRRELERRHEVAAVDRRERVLRALLHPLHRRAQPPRDRDREQLLGIDVQLRAEPAADVGGDHAQLRLGHPERGGGEQPQDVRYLRRRPQRDVPAGLGPGDDATGLDRVRDQRGLHVAVLDDHVGAVVERSRLELPDVRDVRPELLVHEGSAVLRGGLDIDQHLERLVVDVDELRRIDRVRARVRDHDRDTVALVVHLADGEREVLRALHVLGHRPGARHRRLPVVAQIGAGEHGHDALGRLCRGGVDRRDPGVRIRAADDRHDDGARQGEVVDEASTSAQQRIVFLPLQGRPDVSCRGGAHAALPAAAATASTMLW